MAPNMSQTKVYRDEDDKPNNASGVSAAKVPSKCEQLYGPYPSSMPVPFLTSTNEGREGTVPAAAIMETASTMFDLPCDHRDVNCPDEWIPRDGRDDTRST